MIAGYPRSLLARLRLTLANFALFALGIKATGSDWQSIIRQTSEQAANRFLPDLKKFGDQGEIYQRSSWVYIAVNRKATDCSVINLNIFELKDEKKTAIVNHPVEQLMRHPNGWQSQIEFLHSTQAFMELTGNAYWFVDGALNGLPEQLMLLRPDRVMIVPGPDARTRVKGYVYVVDGVEVPLEAEEVIHFNLFHPSDDYYGLSPLEAAALSVTTDLAMQQSNRNVFSKGRAVPAGIVNIKSMVSDPEYDRIVREWQTSYGGTDQKTAFIRGADVEWQNVGLSQKDLDFINARQFSKEEIFQIFGVWPGMLDKNSTEANSLAAIETYDSRTIWPSMLRIAQKISATLCPFYGDNLICEPDDIRKKDEESERREMQARAPFMSINEIRTQLLSLDPYLADPNADVPTLLLKPILPPGGGAFGSSPESGSSPVKSIEVLSSFVDAPLPRLHIPRASQREIEQFARYAAKGKPVDAFHFEATPRPVEMAVKALADIKALHLITYKADGKTYSKSERRMKFALADYFSGLQTRIVSGIKHTTKALPDPKRTANYFDAAFWAAELANLKGFFVGLIHDSVQDAAVDAADALSMSTGIPLDTSVFANYASQYAATYTDQVLKDFNTTTRDGVGAIISRYAADDSATLDDLIGAVQESGLFGDGRAALVARTEATRAFGVGEYMAGDELASIAGVDVAVSQDEMKSVHPAHPGDRCGFTAEFQYDDAGNITGLDYVWNTVKDEKVCPICERRDGKTLREILDGGL